MFSSDSGFSRCTPCRTLVAFLAVSILCDLPDVLRLSGGRAAFVLCAGMERIRSPALDFIPLRLISGTFALSLPVGLCLGCQISINCSNIIGRQRTCQQ